MVYLNDDPVVVNTFPNGETRINSTDFIHGPRAARLKVKFESDLDLMTLMYLRRHLDDKGVTLVDLDFHYFPYSRMDRTQDQFVFTLKYVAEFINKLDFNSITLWDAHSDVTPALLHRAKNISKIPELLDEYRYADKAQKKDRILVFPDAGAAKRYAGIVSKDDRVPVVCRKNRDFLTGQLGYMSTEGNVVEGADYVIVDDLCSFGGTFVGVAALLKAMGANRIDLIVTHCEPNIFKGKLWDSIDKVYTTDSIIHGTVPTEYANRFHVITGL